MNKEVRKIFDELNNAKIIEKVDEDILLNCEPNLISIAYLLTLISELKYEIKILKGEKIING